MANTLSPWDPISFANEAMTVLRKSLGLASRVHRGMDRAPQERGTTINIRKPQTFTAADEPSTEVALAPSVVALTLDKWKGVKVALTDKELTLSGEQVFNDHVQPMATAIADAVDQSVALLYKDIPWTATLTSPAAVADLTNARKIMGNNLVPMDNPAMLHLMADFTISAELLNLGDFARADGAGSDGVETQRRGLLGQKFGFNIFENQNVQTHTTGVSADATGALVGAHAAGATTVAFDAVTAAGTFKAGDTFVIAGNAQRYAFAADATADGGGAVAATAIVPPLVQAYADNAVITITLQSGAQQLAFHRDAFALAMAPLSTMGAEVGGAKMHVVTDEDTNLALRARKFYVGDTSKVYMALDALWGVKTLNPNMAVRLVD